MSKIELINVTKIYGEPKRKGALPEGKKAIDDVSMVIPDQSFTVLVGPSGCGKTTLLRLIAGFQTATEGVITISGKDITQTPPHQRPVNTVFQKQAFQ